MIGFLSGKILDYTGDTLLIDVAGVGYEVAISSRQEVHYHQGAAVSLHIYTHLRADGRSESALELFGFQTLWDKRAFLLLTSVSGVGYRTALGILASIDAHTILTAIVRQDRATITSAPGVGKKTAERLILELTEKAHKLLLEKPHESLGSPSFGSISAARASAPTAAHNNSDHWQEACEALVALGYRESDAATALRHILNENRDADFTTQTFVTTALQHLSRGKLL